MRKGYKGEKKRQKRSWGWAEEVVERGVNTSPPFSPTAAQSLQPVCLGGRIALRPRGMGMGNDHSISPAHSDPLSCVRLAPRFISLVEVALALVASSGAAAFALATVDFADVAWLEGAGPVNTFAAGRCSKPDPVQAMLLCLSSIYCPEKSASL